MTWTPAAIPPWDGKTELSVIIPFCNEIPTTPFTAQSLIEELTGFCKFEIILVDNLSHDHIDMSTVEEKAEGGIAKPARKWEAFSRNYFWNPQKGRMSTWFFRKGIIKHFIYDSKQGHWNAKNFGIQHSGGKYLFFLDAHCIMKRDSVRKMVQFLRDNEGKEYDHPMTPGKKWKVGGVHAYINYLLDSRSLEYRVQRKTMGYQFCTHQSEEYFENGKRLLRFPTKPYQVCVMSTCSMMCPRSVLAELGAWNPEFGIYGGGESYINWKQSTCGYGHWIHPEAWCWHYADTRGYSWNWSDFVRNSFIAAYVVGGDAFLNDQVEQRCAKGGAAHIRELAADVIAKCKEDREFVQSRQVADFETYLSWWEAHPGVWK